MPRSTRVARRALLFGAAAAAALAACGAPSATSEPPAAGTADPQVTSPAVTAAGISATQEATAAMPPSATPTSSGGTQGAKQWSSPPEMTIDPAKTYIAIFRTEKGDIRVQLFADKAPYTVNSFVFLARQGYYDNTTFHRILEDFMAQGGDPTGTGQGGPGYVFPTRLTPRSLSVLPVCLPWPTPASSSLRSRPLPG